MVLRILRIINEIHNSVKNKHAKFLVSKFPPNSENWNNFKLLLNKKNKKHKTVNINKYSNSKFDSFDLNLNGRPFENYKVFKTKKTII